MPVILAIFAQTPKVFSGIVRREMKLLVFAYTPPPHHGQSYMVKLLLDGFAEESKSAKPSQDTPHITCYHVNALFASDVTDMGRFRWQKVWLVFKYCFVAISLRFRHGIENFYYVPAPALKNSLIRDWIILLLCRPFYKRLFLHWHAAGLGGWLEQTQPSFSRWLSHLVLDNADLSIAVSGVNIPDADKFFPKQQALVYNGIADPFPDFTTKILPVRAARLHKRTQRAEETSVVKVLFLSLCCKEKGLIDTVRAMKLANDAALKAGLGLTFQLTVAGKFLNPEEEELFSKTVMDCDLHHCVTYAGFLGGEAKKQAFMEADIFCFPTYYWAEAAVPLVLIEAMACGLPMVASQWRSEPRFYPPHYPGLVAVKNPDQIAGALLELANADLFQFFRDCYLQNFTLSHHLATLKKSFLNAENSNHG